MFASSKEKLKTNDQGYAFFMPKNLSEYGNYMIRVCDESSGHCAGGFFYTGSYYYASGDNPDGPNHAEGGHQMGNHQPFKFHTISSCVPHISDQQPYTH